MKLSEYLVRRNKYAKSLTTAERKAIGVWDYSKGWTYRYANLEVPEQLAAAVLEGYKKKNDLKKIAKGELSFNDQLSKQYKAILMDR